ncbi:MAG: hypothetical protein ABSG49_10880 [Methanoregula sp.]
MKSRFSTTFFRVQRFRDRQESPAARITHRLPTLPSPPGKWVLDEPVIPLRIPPPGM